ncbi:hypothetical protein BJV85_002381 [Clostridium acetobutylicum]|uniref:Uncharacterized protein n=1 Tax=Clostridium acetobutylicum (strain ATCC 824 / DSM 792 / JCM 1419 / IAM 19013 / LMG 5710 / NBRC 13948 / NRRL B-527 / VKM B-1787 / 2291 / W) TaxID=272562 RepID=Q97IM4_CLOAB|nr:MULTISPECIES: hypothetical protein [Clostridium]AAK79583.1 Hypothetical protein CA_C1616 [Clostridium acetobutylicum ATCC 824]ADZ20667.1 Conserved hypothetical protein [Clostridium acetobutylicum EA 2018]AEI31896.1 hypothetical protein SMB_G1641 [Clostridium acetobutylicum DSM 1731]AWV79978.1 hypothetical protein DK921_07685 [Clostridium acetobutylicum]MBC2394035.1 hypothetical protein [Clostridium acetobutylicum]
MKTNILHKATVMLLITLTLSLSISTIFTKNSLAAHQITVPEKSIEYNMKLRCKNTLQELVENKTINQSQADKIFDVLNEKHCHCRNCQKHKIHHHFEKKFSNPLHSLIQDGTLTKSQANIVLKQLKLNSHK